MVNRIVIKEAELMILWRCPVIMHLALGESVDDEFRDVLDVERAFSGFLYVYSEAPCSCAWNSARKIPSGVSTDSAALVFVSLGFPHVAVGESLRQME
jgi:hypothetical protein